jgi:hypothetical protein
MAPFLALVGDPKRYCEDCLLTMVSTNAQALSLCVIGERCGRVWISTGPEALASVTCADDAFALLGEL